MWRYRPVRLEHDPDPGAERRERSPGIEAEHADLALGALAVTLEDLDRRRLAGAVGPEQPEHLAAAHLEVDPADRLELAVGLAQAADLDREIGHREDDASAGSRAVPWHIVARYLRSACATS